MGLNHEFALFEAYFRDRLSIPTPTLTLPRKGGGNQSKRSKGSCAQNKKYRCVIGSLSSGWLPTFSPSTHT